MWLCHSELFYLNFDKIFFYVFLSRAENVKMCVSCKRELSFRGQGDPKEALLAHIFAPIFGEAFQGDFLAVFVDFGLHIGSLWGTFSALFGCLKMGSFLFHFNRIL